MARLLGPDGQPIDTAALKREHAAPTLTGVRPVIAEDPTRGLTPMRLAALMRAAEQGDPISYFELADRIEDKDLHYRSVLSTRKLQVAQLEITVEPAGEEARALADAELVRGWIGRAGLADELVDVLDAIGKGVSVCELLWETSARDWEIRRLVWRDPRWFEPDPADQTALWLREPGGRVALPPYKFLVHRHRTKAGIPVRSGLAWAAAWSFLFKVYALKDWVSFLERYGQPIRIGKYDAAATEEEKRVLLDAVANLGADAAAIVPQQMLIEFVKLEGISANAEIYEKLLHYLDQQVSKLVLGQTTTTDAISGGHAVSREHRKVQEDIERSDARQLAAALNRDVVRPLVDLNRGPPPDGRYPAIRIGRADQVDGAFQVDALAKLLPLGLTVSARRVREIIGLPEPEDDEEMLGGAREPEPEPARQAARRAARPADAIERAVEALLGDGPPLGEALVERILAAAAEVDSAEAFLDRLAALADQLPEGALADALARAGFAAALAGRLGTDLDGARRG